MMHLRDGRAVDIIGNGPLSKTFKLVKVIDTGNIFLVWSDTGKYRKDNKDHPQDVMEWMREC